MAEEIIYDRLLEDVIAAINGAVQNKTDAAQLVNIVERSKNAIRGEYLANNSLLKAKYMKDPNGRLDRHKCAACFMVAFMKKFIIERDNEKFEYYREKLAILAGLTVVGTFIKGRDSCDNTEIIAFLTRNNAFEFPKLLCDKVSSYERNWAIELRSMYNQNQPFSVLSLSDKLFLIESYNRQLAKNDILRQENEMLRESIANATKGKSGD
jgi:hypothetical protein